MIAQDFRHALRGIRTSTGVDNKDTAHAKPNGHTTPATKE